MVTSLNTHPVGSGILTSSVTVVPAAAVWNPVFNSKSAADRHPVRTLVVEDRAQQQSVQHLFEGISPDEAAESNGYHNQETAGSYLGGALFGLCLVAAIFLSWHVSESGGQDMPVQGGPDTAVVSVP
ncbi:hypothetical protein C5L39_02860 [Corynebacterium alimapuense]|uniref:Uncharacterized protein n=1 Tax=Corynebacterium alimapuense TaxID=1576874 RepID=A0A3M8K9W4_9CORY|nr:hypothetical protein C5L39_02860 [Corynebacterium alimapuense]